MSDTDPLVALVWDVGAVAALVQGPTVEGCQADQWDSLGLLLPAHDGGTCYAASCSRHITVL
jgi:hypothetical protein